MDKSKQSVNENQEILKNKDEVETSLKMFRRNIDNFFLATEIDEKALDVHVESLLNLISTDVAEIHNQVESIVEEKSWDNVINRLEEYDRTNRNPLIYQYMFFNRTQRSSESFDDFYKDLQKIMRFCDFGNSAENLMKTQITLGVNNVKSRFKLLEREMNLEYMIIYCRAMELFEKKNKVQASQLNSCFNSSISLQYNSNNKLFSEATCGKETCLPSKMMDLFSSNNTSENSLHESEPSSSSSAPSCSDENKLQRKESASQIDRLEWENLCHNIEGLCNNKTDNFTINKPVNSLGEKDNNRRKRFSHYSNTSLISNTIVENHNVNYDNCFCEIHTDNVLHEIYQDYKLLDDILNLSKAQSCNDNLNAEKSPIKSDSTKPWFSLKNKIFDWLESNNKSNFLKKNLTFIDNPIADKSTNEQSCTDDKDHEHKKSKSQMIAEEILSSGKAYMETLTLLCKNFISFVESVKDGVKIPSVILSKIFSPLPQILILTRFMMIEMESRLQNWNINTTIADIIVSKGPFLKLYSTYIQNFKAQTNLLSESCKKYPRFEKCVKDFEALDICNKLYIKQHMLAPIQIIPKYKLLLSRYLKSLDTNSTDYKNTMTAIDIVSDICQQIDKSVKNGDCMQKLCNIQTKLKNYTIVKPGRELIMEGELYKLSRKRMQLRYFILVNDCLLYAYYQVFGLQVKSELSLKDMKVQCKNEHEFSVITTTRSFTLRALSATACKEWVSTLETTINSYNRRQRSTSQNSKPLTMYDSFQQLQYGYTAPIWIQDCDKTMCHLCATIFTFFTRRHHCRVCGQVLCYKCSANKAPLFYKNFNAVRVCDECFEPTLKEFNEIVPSVLEEAYRSSDFKIIRKFDNIRKTFKSKKKNIVVTYKSTSQTNSNNTSSEISDWLYQRSTRKEWEKFWFVLREQSLYVYKAPEDIVPAYKIDMYMYTVVVFMEGIDFEDYNSNCVFQLSLNSMKDIAPLILRAENKDIANKWINVLKKKTTITF